LQADNDAETREDSFAEGALVTDINYSWSVSSHPREVELPPQRKAFDTEKYPSKGGNNSERQASNGDAEEAQ
jgi:hypothetical protein